MEEASESLGQIGMEIDKQGVFGPVGLMSLDLEWQNLLDCLLSPEAAISLDIGAKNVGNMIDTFEVSPTFVWDHRQWK